MLIGAVVAVQGDDGGDRGVRVLEPRLEGRIAGRETGKRGEMTAAGAARHEHPRRVGPVLVP